MHSNAIVWVLFLCQNKDCKGVDFLNEINLQPNKYIDSYDNECFAPQFFGDDRECTATSTQTRTEKE